MLFRSEKTRRGPRAIHWLLVLVVALSPVVDAWAGDDEDEKKTADSEMETDYINDAARLVHDGHFDRALRVLDEVDLADQKVDKKRYYTLRALAQMELEQFEGARKDFENAIRAGETNPVMQLQLAQACFNLKEYPCALRALDKAGNAATERPGAFLMRAEAEWQLGTEKNDIGQKAKAIGTLEKGAKRFPDKAEFDRIRIFYLIELNLYAEAAAVSKRYLDRTEVTEEDYVAIGEALRTAHDFEGAQLIMEAARLRYPQSPKIVAQLAHAYLADGRKLTSAMLFEDAARLDPKYALEAAELYKDSGFMFRATWMNARVLDQKAKAKQRLSLMLDNEDFEGVTAMLPQLQRLGLAADQNVTYAVGYAFFKTNQFTKAEKELQRITEPQLFESTLQLRKAIESCREAGWECSL